MTPPRSLPGPVLRTKALRLLYKVAAVMGLDIKREWRVVRATLDRMVEDEQRH